jgi:pseudaminic acid cytidylyltransferase
MIVAVIPARGGSKRIPKKNIKEFFGKPIISYSIRAAIDSQLFDKVIVSTDCENIAQVAIKYGAEVPFMRPKELSGDFLGTHEVVGHALQWLEDFGDALDYACCIYATAPMIQGSDLIKGYDLIKTEKWKAVIAATKYSYPLFRSFKKIT